MMKKYILFGLVTLIFPLMSINAQKITLPAACAKILDKEFKGWKMAEVNKAAADWIKRSKKPFAPNLIKGDFDGNGKTDYAVMIQRENNAQPAISTVVFLHSAKGYKMFDLEGGDGDYIVLEKKGTRAFDHDKNKGFAHKYDAVSVGIWEKAATSYIWKNGKFNGVITSD